MSVALLVPPVVVAVMVSPLLPVYQILLRYRSVLRRELVKVQVTAAAGIVNVALTTPPDRVGWLAVTLPLQTRLKL